MDHMKYNGGTKLAGEAACRHLSTKAAGYLNSRPVSVFEYDNENGEKRYAYYQGYDYPEDGALRHEGLTFEELQEAFEKMQAEKEKDDNGGLDMDNTGEIMNPDEFLTGDYVRTPRGSFHLTALSREQMQAAGYGLHHESDDGKYYIMGNGTRAFAVAKQPEKTEKPYEFEYQLLDRLRTDCEYFLGAGNREAKNLYAGSVEEQIAKMRELYNILPEKPEWLTEQDIERYEKFMTTAPAPEAQPADKNLTALLTVIQGGMTKYLDMGDASMDDIFRQLKKAALPFIEIKGDVIHDEGRFAELEQGGKVLVSVTADIDNDRLTVYEINGVPEAERTDENTRIWSREKMTNFLKDRVREPKTDNSQHSPFHGVGRSHVSEHEREM